MRELEGLDDVDRKLVLLLGDKRVGLALVAGATGAATAVHVVLVVVGHLVVDHQVQLPHVQATRHDRRRDEDVADALFKVGQGVITVVLVHAAVKRAAQVALLHQAAEELVSKLLAIHENEHAAIGVVPSCL